jgi:biopolymer transport protein ExbD
MKFPRNARIFQGRLDAAPFVSVLFLLVIFLLLGALVYTPGGLPIRLPATPAMPRPDGPSVSVALDRNGELYYENRHVTQRGELESSLAAKARETSKGLTLIILADREASHGEVVDLEMLARQAGITNLETATLPRVYDYLNTKSGAGGAKEVQ